MTPKDQNNVQYTLNQILAFAGHEKNEQINLLKMLLNATEQNATLFKQHLLAKRRNEACEMSHKMLTIFRQLEAQPIVSRLELLEQIDNGVLSDSRFFSIGDEVYSMIEFIINHITNHHIDR